MMVHIGAEVVVIGGVFFYLNSKINKIEMGIGDAITISERMRKLEDIIRSQQDIIAKHEEILRQICSRPMPLAQPQHRQNENPHQPRQPNKEDNSIYKEQNVENNALDRDAEQLLQQELENAQGKATFTLTVKDPDSLKGTDPESIKRRKVKRKKKDVSPPQPN